MASFFAGTSGFNYKHWGNGVFYPSGLPLSKWLKFYAANFNSLELNVTFYRLPSLLTFKKWYKDTPDDFTFALKGSRFITHIKRLADPILALTTFFNNANVLAKKLGVVLWQLPANFGFNLERLSFFCQSLKTQTLSENVRQAFEFRNESWFREETYSVLKKYDFALCIAHSRIWPYEEVVTGNYVYLRFHGDNLYSSSYSDYQLKNWSVKIKRWLRDGKDVYAYFNNDAFGFAVKNAARLKELVEE